MPLLADELDTLGAIIGRREQMRVWVLNDLTAILFGTGRVATESDGPALWIRLTRDGP
ncbi:hypothetical protein [Nocardia brasiliensis]|uniref:hypothetical protein n=1 Tax=Nocardia brasiliensis TaxID=37326 RepID=UPI002454026D|nr:hypothetical protein [Nocardia brasiliensis]